MGSFADTSLRGRQEPVEAQTYNTSIASFSSFSNFELSFGWLQLRAETKSHELSDAKEPGDL